MSSLQFLLPAALLALISLPLVVLFHMRSPTPRSIPVPALRFWRVAAPRPTDEPRFRRPPLTPELIIHLLIALLLSLALARPVADVLAGSLGSSSDPKHLIMLLDGSTSMLATGSDPGKTRFDEARAEAIDRINSLRSGDAVTLVVLGARTTTRAASDLGAIDQLASDLGKMPAPGGVADLSAALLLAADLRVPGATNQLVLLSDGALTADPTSIDALGMPIDDIRFGSEQAGNAGIVAIERRNDPANPSSQQVLATIANFSSEPVSLSASLSADNVPISAQDTTLAPDQRQILTFSAPSGTSFATVTITANDTQPLDDSATIQLDAGGAGSLNVLIFSDFPDPLARAFGALPGSRITVETTDAATEGMGTSGYDLVVYDQIIPASAPISPALFVAPPDSSYFRSPAMLADSAITATDPGDRLLSGVDLTGVSFGTTPRYDLPAGFTVPVSASDGPLIAYGTLDGSGLPAALIATPLDAGTFTERIAFPILIANIASALAPPPDTATLSLGDVITVTPHAGAASVTFSDPAGKRTKIDLPSDPAASSDLRTVSYAQTNLPGTYSIEERDTTGTMIATRSVSVNAGDPSESDIRAHPELGAALARASAAESGVTTTPNQTDLWPLFAVAVILLLLIEWALALRARSLARGSHRPRSSGAMP